MNIETFYEMSALIIVALFFVIAFLPARKYTQTMRQKIAFLSVFAPFIITVPALLLVLAGENGLAAISFVIGMILWGLIWLLIAKEVAGMYEYLKQNSHFWRTLIFFWPNEKDFKMRGGALVAIGLVALVIFIPRL